MYDLVELNVAILHRFVEFASSNDTAAALSIVAHALPYRLKISRAILRSSPEHKEVIVENSFTEFLKNRKVNSSQLYVNTNGLNSGMAPVSSSPLVTNASTLAKNNMKAISLNASQTREVMNKLVKVLPSKNIECENCKSDYVVDHLHYYVVSCKYENSVSILTFY